MTYPAQGPIEEFGRRVEEYAGKDVCAEVMAGSERLSRKSSGAEVAHWTKGALERLEAAVAAPIVAQIMEQCGRTCARMHAGSVDEARVRRARYATEEAFLEAEVQQPPTGTRLQREGNVLRQFYTPRSYTHPGRCYCATVRGLPEGETMSVSYCQCSRAFVETVWENALGRPVTVELIESSISGADECEFRITI
ncbi:MAG: DUF6144 family protein [Anaerolineae bacterium]